MATSLPRPARRMPSEREPTLVDSTTCLEDPAWQPTLRDKLRRYRYGSVPGWFDRIDGRPLPDGSIAAIADSYTQARLRRRMAGDLALHTAVVTALVAVGVLVPAIAQPLRTAFTAPWTLVALAAALLALLVLLKLALDAPRLRVVLFATYTIGVAVLLVAIEFQWTPTGTSHDLVACSVCFTVATVAYTLLSGVQRKGVFLGFTTLWPLLLLVASVGVAVASVIPDTFLQQGASLLAVLSLVVATYVVVYETIEFLHKLTPYEAPLAVFLVHIDMAAVTCYAVRIAVIGVVGITIGVLACVIEPLVAVARLVVIAWHNPRAVVACDSWSCGLDCNCTRSRPHQARVAVDLPATYARDMDAATAARLNAFVEATRVVRETRGNHTDTAMADRLDGFDTMQSVREMQMQR